MKAFAGVGSLLLVMFIMTATPALAGGGGPGSAYNEDNDTNDNNTPNNVVDDGDDQHPSGNDRSIENGGSGNQGNSGSDPDGDSNGGEDKPNGSGGNDKADQDGNNGCGNDDDFEDDNNGNCGKADEVSVQSCPGTDEKSKDKNKGHSNCHNPAPIATGSNSDECLDAETMEESSDECEGDTEGEIRGNPEDDNVLGGIIRGSDPSGSEVLGDSLTNSDEVAAAQDRGTSGSSLPYTGVSILIFVAMGTALIVFGYLFMHRRNHWV